jgi:hypothetical protein
LLAFAEEEEEGVVVELLLSVENDHNPPRCRRGA